MKKRHKFITIMKISRGGVGLLLAIASNSANECNLAKQPYQFKLPSLQRECIPGYHHPVYHIKFQECYDPNMQNIQLQLSTPNFSLSPKCTFGRPRWLSLELQKIDSEKNTRLTHKDRPFESSPLLHQKPVGGNEDHLLHTR